MCWEAKEFIWLVLLRYLLYFGGLEKNLWYLWGLLVSFLWMPWLREDLKTLGLNLQESYLIWSPESFEWEVTHGERQKPWFWIFVGWNLRYALSSANIPDSQHVSSLCQQSVNICVTFSFNKIIDFNYIFSVLLDFPGIRAKWSH